jgi:membrane-associated phospholipid phosphatase
VSAAGSLAAFAALAVAVAGGDTWSWDARGGGPYVTWAVAAGSRNTAAVALCACAAVAIWRRNATLAMLTCSLGAATAAVPFLQTAISRGAAGAELYPSGHAVGALVAAVSTIACTATLTGRRAWRAAAAAVGAAIGVVGVTAAVVSGTHHPTDAIGSALWVGAAVAAGLAAARPAERLAAQRTGAHRDATAGASGTQTTR